MKKFKFFISKYVVLKSGRRFISNKTVEVESEDHVMAFSTLCQNNVGAKISLVNWPTTYK